MNDCIPVSTFIKLAAAMLFAFVACSFAVWNTACAVTMARMEKDVQFLRETFMELSTKAHQARLAALVAKGKEAGNE
jgi:hypothetical protein